MGVTGLWKLIETSGKPVPLDTLENKVLAIDISIWLHQVVKGYQDNKGGHLPNAHLLGLFNRLCKLLYFRIKPVFVFDGGCPALKRETIIKRNQSKNKLQNEADRIQHLLLESLAKEKIVKQALGSAVNQLVSPSKTRTLEINKKEEKEDMFKLPPLREENQEDIKDASLTSLDSSVEECAKTNYNFNLGSIDVNSSQFKSLPADIRHDILQDIKDTRKQNSWGRLHELPVESNTFSSFQMEKLLKRRQVQLSLEEAEKEMGGKVFSLSELESLLSEDGVLMASKHCQQIASDENTRFLLVRDLKRTIQEAQKAEVKVKEDSCSPPKITKLDFLMNQQPSTSSGVTSSNSPESSDPTDQMGDEYDLELQQAIQMSLMPPNPTETKLNTDQKKLYANAVRNDAVRGFILEYGGMNDEEIDSMLENTQLETQTNGIDLFGQQFVHNDAYILHGTPEKKLIEPKRIETEESEEIGVISDSDDSDLEEVHEQKIVISLQSNVVEAYKKEEDIFADIFEDKEEVLSDSTIIYDPNETENPLLSIDNSKTVLVDEEIGETEQRAKAETESTKIIEQSATQENFGVSNIAILPEEKPDDSSIIQISDTSSKIKTTRIVHEQSKLDALLSSLKQQKSEISLKSPPMVSYSPNFLDLDEEIEIETEIMNEMNGVQKNSGSIEPQDNYLAQANEALESLSDDEDLPAKSPVKIFQQTTPSKLIQDDSSDIPKLPSPFFVNRTPKSKKKDENSTETNSNKVVKSLFTQNTEIVSPVKLSSEQVLQAAADSMRKNATDAELKDMATKLASEQKDLLKERNKQDRMGLSITEQMSNDCKVLLRLFGIPYIDAPMEAEAQCAYLNEHQLTNGTITDDSDIWLFGGKTVYKNFFVQKKLVMEFQSDNIKNTFNLDRKNLIQLAMLVGSDYTTGINGVGSVTALEILAAFQQTEESGGTTEYMSMMSNLRKFREWWANGKNVGPGGKTALKSKLKNIELIEGFPNINIAKAYMEPIVDDNKEAFSWGHPDIESIHEFAKKNLGWTRSKTEEILEPVIKKLAEKKQMNIMNYFKVQESKKHYDSTKMSKRVQKAVEKMSGIDVPEPEKKVKRTRKQPTKKASEEKIAQSAPAANETGVIELSDDEEGDESPKKILKIEIPKVVKSRKPKANVKKSETPQLGTSTLSSFFNKSSSSSLNSPAEFVQTPKTARIPNTKQIIPQREKDKAKVAEDRKKAVETFKKLQDSKKCMK